MRRLSIALLLVAGLLLLTPAAAAAAPQSSDPADGAALDDAPSRITLTFTREPDPDESHVTVLGGDGQSVGNTDRPARDGLSLNQPVTIQQPGDFTIVYHVVFADGGQEQGSRRFSVGTGAAPDPAAAPPAAAHAHSVDPVSATLLVIDGLVVIVAVFLLMTRRPGAEPKAWRLRMERKSDDRTA